MTAKGEGDYCAFTKAVEHLGDRWSLVILRELTIHGTRGFNALADGVPGISRSVLAARLKKLEDLELVARDPSSRRGVPGYQLTRAGRELQPILRGLWQWSLRFVPEDPAMAERDPDIVIRWLADRVDVSNVPDRPVVLDLDVSGTGTRRFWLVLERGTPPSICIEDPLLAGDRYVFVEADVRALYPIARRMRGWSAAIGDGSVEVFGAPKLVEALPSWFARDETGVSDENGLLHGPAMTNHSVAPVRAPAAANPIELS
jgi:DNA-binding HxlR family transcriptional regulator